MKNLMFTALALLILAACSGGAPATNGVPTATATHAQATATQAQATPTVAPTTAATAVTGNVDACSLLTVAEVAAASGFELDTAEPSAVEAYSYCKYTGATSDEVRTFVLTNADNASSVFGTMKINKGQAVPGVGDEAYWSTDSFQPGLYFLKGGLLGYISGSVFGPEDPMITLGKLMASRM